MLVLVVDAFAVAVGGPGGVEPLGDGFEEVSGVWVVVGVKGVEFGPVEWVEDTSADERNRVIKVAVDAGDFGRVVSGWARPVRQAEGRVAAVERARALRADWLGHGETSSSREGDKSSLDVAGLRFGGSLS